MDGVINMGKLKVASLFCGCGGMDLGLLGGFTFLNKTYSNFPFEIVYALDNDKYAAQIYNINFTHKCEIDDIKNVFERNLPSHELLIGGFPCQSFSIVAQNPPRLGYKDDKGKLFFEMVRILKEKEPRYFIAENVKGLLSVNNKKTFPMIIKEFESAGYFVKYQLMNSSDFGIPQKRERIFIIGFKDYNEYFDFKFPTPTTTGDKKAKLKEVVDVDHSIDEKYFFSNKAVEGMLKVQKKMNKGRIQNFDEPCNTISSHLSKISLNGTDPVLFVNNRYRRFTPREAANIQSFPENFKLDIVSENRQYKAIGNAVPPVLMWYIINSLVDVISL